MSEDILEKALKAGEVYFAKFGRTIPFDSDQYEEDFRYDDEKDYERKCVETFLNWNEFVWSELQTATLYYYQDIEGIDELTEANTLNVNLPEDIWQHCHPNGIRFERFKEYPADVFAIVSLECDWEPEHGLCWVVKNTDEPIFVGAQGNLHSVSEKQEHFNYA